MATKTEVFLSKDDTKPIQFCLVFDGNLTEPNLKHVFMEPNQYDNILLLRNGSSVGQYDVMYAYNQSNPTLGFVYYGYWNNGKAR